MIELTDDNLHEIMHTDKPIMLEFWGEWCQPCKALLPIVGQIAHERPDIVFASVNVGKYGGYANRYGVSTLPTMVLVKNGMVIDKKVGFISREVILEMLGG